MGNGFPARRVQSLTRATYAEAISEALRADLGGNLHAIKTVMHWTGSSERTVKNWISGTHGPTGEHLITLAHHSESVMRVLFQLVGKTDATVQLDTALLRARVIELLAIIDGQPSVLKEANRKRQS